MFSGIKSGFRAAARYRAFQIRHPRMRVVFVTFADGETFESERIAREVSTLGIFNKVIRYDPSMLPDLFLGRPKDELRTLRGYGFWAWKPYVMLEALKTMRDGDILVYADAGCSVSTDSSRIARELMETLKRSSEGLMLTANPYSRFVTRHWTKADLLAHFGLLGNIEFLDSPQLEAGRIAMVKSQWTVQFLEQWSTTASDMHLIDDSPSVVQNDPTFREHRHDQSIFNILIRSKSYLTGLEKVFHATRLRATQTRLTSN
jgi:hypothetical protein